MKLINSNTTIIITLLISLIIGCAERDAKKNLVGGPCEYKEIAGTAVISSITEAHSDELNCNEEPVEVSFKFTADDPKAVNKYLFPNDLGNQKIKLGGGLNPPKDYMKVKRIIVGTSHKCVRKEIIKGTCTPVLYELPQIDFSDYGKYCW